MPDQTIINRVRACVDRLYADDRYLIVNKAHERSVTHKLAEYIQQEFGEWNVDCEYDLFGTDQKKALDGLAELCGGDRTDTVLPDIIVHRRGSVGENNLLVVEAKKSGRSTSCDEAKLKLFTATDGRFKYQQGLLLTLDETPTLRWYENGSAV